MKKLLIVGFAAIMLVACGDLSKVTSVAEPIEEQDKEVIELSTAEPGDTVTDESGTYSIEKVSEPKSTHISKPISLTLQKVLLATFVPNEENASFFDDKELTLAITIIEGENTSEDTVYFDPFSAKVTTNTKGQYEAQTMLNTGDGEFIGQVRQKFTTAYNLKDEALSEIEELTFVINGTSKDSRTIGDDVTIKVPFK